MDFSELANCGKVVVLDTETTGLSPAKDRVITLGMIRLDFSRINVDKLSYEHDRYDLTFNPGQPIPEGATQIHGITDQDVAGEPMFADLAQEIRDWIGEQPIIGHNVRYDLSMLDAEFQRAGMSALGNQTLCTMWRYREWNDGMRKGSRLDDVVREFRITGRSTDQHGALEDARITTEIAILFYLHDTGQKNHLPDTPPAQRSQRHRRRDQDEDFDDYLDEEEDSGCGLLGLGLLVLLAILIFS